MVVPASGAWRVALTLVLAGAIFASACARAPKRAARGSELGRLVVCALGLYALGAIASLTHHPLLAGLVYASGIAVCAFAAWLSRGSDSDDPPGGDQPADEEPPRDPDGVPGFDWAQFERQFRAYASRSQHHARRR
ncbi:MAG: hypothetical protein ABSG43_08600 [Solirubrobacteraceae bacterium]|jgi:hypothetical protein